MWSRGQYDIPIRNGGIPSLMFFSIHYYQFFILFFDLFYSPDSLLIDRKSAIMVV